MRLGVSAPCGDFVCEHSLPCRRNQDEDVKSPRAQTRIECVAQIRSNAIPVVSEKKVGAEVNDRDAIERQFLGERSEQLNCEFDEQALGRFRTCRFASSSGMKRPPPICQRSRPSQRSKSAAQPTSGDSTLQ